MPEQESWHSTHVQGQVIHGLPLHAFMDDMAVVRCLCAI